MGSKFSWHKEGRQIKKIMPVGPIAIGQSVVLEPIVLSLHPHVQKIGKGFAS